MRPASDCIILVRQARRSVPHIPCPAGPWADGTVSGADVDNQGSQSVSWPVHSSAVPHWGFGPEWDSPDNPPSPKSSCTTHNAAGLALQLGPWASQGPWSVVLCRERCQSRRLRPMSVQTHLLMQRSVKARFAFKSPSKLFSFLLLIGNDALPPDV